MKKHITVVTMNDSHLELRGEVLFDPTEKSLIIQGGSGAYLSFNWDHVEFFIVQPCENCEDHDDE